MNNPLNLKPCAMVVVYEDPISRTQPEGLAELVERVDAMCSGTMETWWVKFPDPLDPRPKNYRRKILNEAMDAVQQQGVQV
jgi:hypothetical protein